MFQLNLENTLKELYKIKAKRIFVQIPEGLKTMTEEIEKKLNKFELVINMDPCFGACDLKESEANRLGCDVILHLGHSAFQKKTNLKVIYALLPYKLKNFEKILTKIQEYLKKNNIKNVSLTTTIQFINYLPKIKTNLEKKGIKCFLESGKRVVNGQVLGCNYSAINKNAKAIIYFGDGLFHPLGLAFSSEKKVIIVNPFEEKIFELDKEKNNFLRKRILLIESAKEKKNFGIIVSTKQGQNRIEKAFEIKKILEKNGKKVIIYSADMLSPNNLLGIKSEVLINTACPRIGIDDFINYKQIVLNYYEINYLLGKNYETYLIPREF
jgi:2-(3-amino-3-carboxypropyl)histidine synthase